MAQVKLIWDFRGPNAKPIAEHHAKHLSEFIKIEGIENATVDTEEISEMFHTAFIIVDESLMDLIRERLKPNRGQRVPS